MVLLKNYLSILSMVVYLHINNPCLAWRKFDVCIAEISDLFVDCSPCAMYHTHKEYITYTLSKIVYNDIKSTHAKRFINYLFNGVSVHNRLFLPVSPKTPENFCSRYKTTEHRIQCIGHMRFVKFPLNEASKSMKKVFYEWSFKRVNREIDNVHKQFMLDYIEHVKENFRYEKSNLLLGYPVEAFCNQYSETTFDFIESEAQKTGSQTEDIDVVIHRERAINESVFFPIHKVEDCLEKINETFKDCTDCSSGKEYINYVFLKIIYTDINSIYTKFFVDFLYTAVSAKKNETIRVDNTMSPNSFCKGDEKCLDTMTALHFHTTETLSSVRKVYYEFNQTPDDTNVDNKMMNNYINQIVKNYTYEILLPSPDKSNDDNQNDVEHAELNENDTEAVDAEHQTKDEIIDPYTPDLFCEANWKKMGKYDACVKNILEKFKDCNECHEEANLKFFIDYAFEYINSFDILGSEFAESFLRFIYNAVDVISPEIPNSPKKFCESKALMKYDDNINNGEFEGPYERDPKIEDELELNKWKKNCLETFYDDKFKNNPKVNIEENISYMEKIFFYWTYEKAKKNLHNEQAEIIKEYILHMQTSYDFMVKNLNTVDTVKTYCMYVTKLLV